MAPGTGPGSVGICGAGLATTGAVGAAGVGKDGARPGADVAGGSVAGRAATGTAGLGPADALGAGKPIMVWRGCCDAGGGGSPGVGCGVAPVRAAGIATEGRGLGIIGGRGGAWTGAAGVGAVGIGRAPEGLVGGRVAQPAELGAGTGPRSMVISP